MSLESIFWTLVSFILHTSCEAQLRKCSHHDPEIADMCTALAGQLQSLITDRHKRKKKVLKSKEHLSIYKSIHCWIIKYEFVIIICVGCPIPSLVLLNSQTG